MTTSVYLNAFDLLGDDESDDVAVLYDRMKKKTVELVPSSPTKSKKEHVVVDDVKGSGESKKGNKQAVSNGNGEVRNEKKEQSEEIQGDGWKFVSKKVPAKQVQKNVDQRSTNGNGSQNHSGERKGQGNRRVQRANGGSEQPKGEGHVNGEKPRSNGDRPRNNGNWNDRGSRRGNGGNRGQGRTNMEYRRVNDGEVKESNNVANGNGANAGLSNLISEGDAVVSVESSNAEAGEKEITEEVKVPVPEETEEERKKREDRQRNKEAEDERRRKYQEEIAEEAKKMTLAQYEKTLLKKKQEALNLQKAEARRVVADKDLENMKLVGKKQDKDEVLIIEREKSKGKAVIHKPTSGETLKKSDSFEKKGRKPVEANLAKLFRPASFRGSNAGGGMGRDRDNGNQGNLGGRLPLGGRPSGPPTKDEFPVLGAAPEPVPEPPVPAVNPSAPAGNRSYSGGNPSGPSMNRSSYGGNRSSYGGNRSAPSSSRSGPRDGRSASGGYYANNNGHRSSATGPISAPGANSSV